MIAAAREWAKHWARIGLRAPRIAKDTFYDLRRFIRHSTAVESGDGAAQLRAIIIRKAHNIEKGLSLPNPRPLFGFGQLRDLVRFTDRHMRLHGENEVTDIAHAVVRAYLDFNRQKEASDPYLETLERFVANGRDTRREVGGVTGHQAVDRPALDPVALTRFIRSRTSVRNYRPEPVPEAMLAKAAACAARAPAVCNRQFGRVWHTSDRERIAQMLDIQGGARGFLETVPTLLMVTTDLSAYTGDERYQSWIDGGLFAMNLLLGLEAQGISSCCLNWSKGRQTDRVMRAVAPITESENIIMLIACGFASEEARVPVSTRQPAGYFLNRIP